jgi:hypothetical protein
MVRFWLSSLAKLNSIISTGVGKSFPKKPIKIQQIPSTILIIPSCLQKKAKQVSLVFYFIFTNMLIKMQSSYKMIGHRDS